MQSEKVGTGRVRWNRETQQHLDRDPRVIEWKEDGEELVFSYSLSGDETGIFRASARQLHIDDLSSRMSQSTISTFQLFEMFPDEETARKYLEDRLWPLGAICPQCKSGTRVIVRPNGFYRCNGCKKFTFSIRTGTIFGRSKIPLHKWVYAMYLLVTSRKGIGSMQLAKEIGVTQKSTWFMLQRLREACGNKEVIA